MKKYKAADLVLRSLELDCLEEDMELVKAFLNKIIAYDDLPSSDAVIDDIIMEAKSIMKVI